MSAPEVRRVSKGTRRVSRAAATAPTPAPGDAGTVASGNVEIASQEIARLAHSYWEARGGQAGSREADWLRAEQQFRAAR